MSRSLHGGSVLANGTEGPATQAHSHSQLGWQGGPVDPVPALGASSGSHPGVLGDRVSAQEILREESSGSFFSGHWYSSPGLLSPCPIPPPQLPQVPSSPRQRRDSSLPKCQEVGSCIGCLLVDRHCGQAWGPETGVTPAQPSRGEWM